MTARQILLDGALLTVEVDDDAPPALHRTLQDEGPEGFAPERGGVVDRMGDVGPAFRGLLAGVAAPIRAAMTALAPEEWSMELSIGFKGEAGIPCLTKAEANGAVKVVVTWKR